MNLTPSASGYYQIKKVVSVYFAPANFFAVFFKDLAGLPQSVRESGHLCLVDIHQATELGASDGPPSHTSDTSEAACQLQRDKRRGTVDWVMRQTIGDRASGHQMDPLLTPRTPRKQHASFSETRGVAQGCCLSALLFFLTVDWVMRQTIGDRARGHQMDPLLTPRTPRKQHASFSETRGVALSTG